MSRVQGGARRGRPDDRVHLIDIFENRPQLVIYHFMFHPEWEEGCPRR
jgi:predicted dithiol-disulfide oxidoreductase (DUF899 family)